ncbi:MAG: SURF1 family protein [Ardenticatenaceae bacterium]|nr:SURF1 family protein [Anaerolineales bacterium]MCB8920896.1 SURF1 family protein [Ardenticatenaceae bacterium]
MTFLRTLFNRRWWWATLLVLLAMGVMVRLSIWQLDRLAQRRAANAELQLMLDADPLVLTGAFATDTTLTQLPNRRVTAVGEFDFSQQLALKVQNWQGRAGIHLIAPLMLDAETAVLVDRGWIPDSEAPPENWATYDETGPVTIDGYVALSQTLSRTAVAPPDAPQQEWFRVDIAAIQPQMPYRLLPIYILQSPAGDNSKLPFRAEPEIDLSEGPHLSYAIQWLLFTVILGGGYLYFVRKNSAPSAS